MSRWLGILVALGFLVPACGFAQDAADAETARAAVQAAEQAVHAARARKALWTTAEEALEEARTALSRADYSAALIAAQRAARQATLGIEQTGYPDFAWLIKESP